MKDLYKSLKILSTELVPWHNLKKQDENEGVRVEDLLFIVDTMLEEVENKLQELTGYSYKGRSLKELLKPVKEKVSQSSSLALMPSKAFSITFESGFFEIRLIRGTIMSEAIIAKAPQLMGD